CRGPIHWRMVPSSDSNWPLRTVLRASSRHWSRPTYGRGITCRTPIKAIPCPQTPIRVPRANSLAHGPIQRLELASAHCPAGLFTPLVSAHVWTGNHVSHADQGYPLPTDAHSRAEGQFTGAWSHPATRTGLCALSCGPLHATG